MTGRTKSEVLEWLIVLVPSIAGYAAAELVGLRQLWEDGLIYTVVVFATVISVQRLAWGQRAFWTGLVMILAAHTLILTTIVQSLEPRRFGFPKILLLPIAAIEGTFIVAILRKRTRDLRSRKTGKTGAD